MRYEVSNLVEDIAVTHRAQHFLGVSVGNGVLELGANLSARLLSAIVATSSAIRTLALLPLLLAISPSRIRTLRVMAVFQPSLATRNLRSISRPMSVSSARRRSTPHYAAAPPTIARQ